MLISDDRRSLSADAGNPVHQWQCLKKFFLNNSVTYFYSAQLCIK